MTGTDEEKRERQRQITAVVLKILGVAVSIGLAIGIGAWVLVKAIGLDSTDAAGAGPGDIASIAPLPTTALPVPSDSTSPSPNPGVVTTPPSGSLYLSASPVLVKPMERINLTGQWPGHDNESVMVQRFEGGKWADFGVQARVNVGTFETYVMTGHSGEQKFRVVDPQTGAESNEVTVTVQ